MASLLPCPPKPPQNPSPKFHCSSRRSFAIGNAAASIVSLAVALALPEISSPTPALSVAEQEVAPPRKPLLPGISSTKSWFQFYGDGFSIRVPPQFEDVMEPEDFNAGLSLYGDKAKPKTFAARFASPDGYLGLTWYLMAEKATGCVLLDKYQLYKVASMYTNMTTVNTKSEVVSVVIRSSNQLKITFLEAKDITDIGSLKQAAKIFVPGGANLYSARTIKIREDETVRSYYFYEFGLEDQHVALVATINSGKAYIAGATAPHLKWEKDGVKLRSAAVSLSVL